MNIISPLTLLIVPLIGSLIIVSYPYLTDKDTTPFWLSPPLLTANLKSSQVTQAFSLARERSAELIQMPMTDKKNSNLKKIAIITSLVNFIISILIWIQFDSSYIGYQFVTEISGSHGLAKPEFIQLNLGVDGISLFFVLLTTFITPIALLSSHNDIEKNLKFYLVSILLLETLQIAVFVVLDLLLFYIFFESVLIPLFFIVGV
jgi:NADH:ubiquinone oxidoreductase subunit 4 (subunit M)